MVRWQPSWYDASQCVMAESRGGCSLALKRLCAHEAISTRTRTRTHCNWRVYLVLVMLQVIALRGDFSVPADGYLAITGIGADENPVLLCPNSAASLEDCDRNAAKGLTGTFRLTFFGVDLGPQTVCVEAHKWPSAADKSVSLLEDTCAVLVGSEFFPGLYESVLYFEDHEEEFIGSEALVVFWEHLGSLQGSDPFALMSISRREGREERLLGGRWGGGGLNSSAARILGVCVGAACRGGAGGEDELVVDDVRSSRRQQLLHLREGVRGGVGVGVDTVWREVRGEAETLRAVIVHDLSSARCPPSQSCGGFVEAVVASLGETLESAEPVVVVVLAAGENRTALLPALVSLLDQRGYHTFLAGTKRLVILNGDMWHSAYARAIRNQDGQLAEEEEMVFVAIKHGRPLYGRVLRAYNASGLVVGCEPYRMSSFHTPDGYWADDCPPNFNVYRSSRLRLFENRSAIQQGRSLHPASLLRHRRNVFSGV